MNTKEMNKRELDQLVLYFLSTQNIYNLYLTDEGKKMISVIAKEN